MSAGVVCNAMTLTVIVAASIGSIRASHVLNSMGFVVGQTFPSQFRSPGKTVPAFGTGRVRNSFVDRRCQILGRRLPTPPLLWLQMATTSNARQQRRTEANSQRGAKTGDEGKKRLENARGGEKRSKDKKPPAVPMAELKEKPDISEKLAEGSSLVVLAPGKARLFYEGNPVVYGGAVYAVLGNAVSGDTVFVVDRNGGPIGWGAYNEDSMYRVRMLWLCAVDGPLPAQPQLVDVLAARFRTARAVRQAQLLPREGTDAYRLINGEGDRLSGLVVDVYGTTAVVASSARWVEVHKAAVMEAFQIAMAGAEVEVVWRQSVDRLRQDGFHLATRAEKKQEESENDDHTKQGDGEEGEEEQGNDKAMQSWEEEEVVVEEYGIKYAVAPRKGHKTGHYLDQRDNRHRLGQLCKGRAVLDTFCYSGGFSINAAIAGAARVDAVDSSAPALALAARNAQLNGLQVSSAEPNGDPSAVLTLHRADVAKFLSESVAAGREWDVVVLDPPKLAPSRKDLDRAKTKYKKLNKAALQCVRGGGLLLSCTCSAAMAQTGTLLDIIRAAAAETGRQVTVVSVSGPGGDHPVSPAFPEGQYLTAYLLAVN